MTPLLLGTHAACVAVTFGLTRWITLRSVRIREVEGHAVLEFHHAHDDDKDHAMPPTNRPPAARERRYSERLMLIVLVASLFVIGIGVSAALSARSDREARKVVASQTECVNRFAKKLAQTYTIRANASVRLERAQAAKDAANDATLLAVFGIRSTPPNATPRDFDRALAEFAHAKARLVRVQDQVATVRAENPLPDPPERLCP